MAEQHQAGARPQGGARRSDEAAGTRYPGKDLGFPESGPGSIASMGRRLGAFFADWLLCTVIAAAFIRGHVGSPHYWAELRDWTLILFAAQDFILSGLLGGTVGKRLFRLRVLRVDGRLLGLGWALLRTALLLTVVPPLVQDGDMRGLHDRAANSAVVMM